MKRHSCTPVNAMASKGGRRRRRRSRGRSYLDLHPNVIRDVVGFISDRCYEDLSKGKERKGKERNTEEYEEVKEGQGTGRKVTIQHSSTVVGRYTQHKDVQ